MKTVGKREFLMHSSKYLKEVEVQGHEITITHQNEPTLKLVPVKPKTIHDLRGLITTPVSMTELNKPVLPSFDKWFS